MATKNKVVVTSGLKRGDYRRLTYWNVLGKNKAMPWILAGLLLAGAGACLLGWRNTNARIIGIICMACPVIILAMMEINIFNVVRKGHLEARTTATYTIDGVGIMARSPVAQYPLAYNWRDVEGVYENSRFYMIFINKVQMMSIRKTDLAPADREGLLALVHKNVKAEKIHLK